MINKLLTKESRMRYYLLIVLMLTSSSLSYGFPYGGKKNKKTNKNEQKSKSVYGKYENCRWYIEAACVEGKLCGFGESRKSNPALSRRTATARARAELAEQISSRVKSLLRDHMEESGVYGNAMASEYTESIIKQVAEQVLEYSSIDDTCFLKDNTFVVRVAWSKDAVKKATAVAIKREEALYSKFLGEQAFKRLEEETKNSARWDEEIKEK